MPEMITEGMDDDDKNDMSLAEQYEEWRGQNLIIDEEEDEESGGDGVSSGIHTNWVESEIKNIKMERWHRQKVGNVEKESKEEGSAYKKKRWTRKEVKKQEKRLRITRRRVNATEEKKREVVVDTDTSKK